MIKMEDQPGTNAFVPMKDAAGLNYGDGSGDGQKSRNGSGARQTRLANRMVGSS